MVGGIRAAVARRLRELASERCGSVLQLELAMGHRPGFVSDALAGRKRLTFELVDQVLAHLGLGVEAILQPSPAPDEVAERLETYPPDDVARALARALVRKGVLSPQDLEPED